MDEGHQAVVNNHDGLKSLLDGTLSGTYNLSFFTSMNSTEEYLRKEKENFRGTVGLRSLQLNH